MKTRKRRKRPPTLTVESILGADLSRSMDLLMICDTEVRKYTGVESDLWGALVPPKAFARLHGEMYRSHVRELLSRAEAGLRIDTMTKAELLIDLIEASFRVPLDRTGSALYHHLFRSCMGVDSYRAIFDGIAPPRERWEGQIDEIIATFNDRPSPHGRIRKASTRPRRKVG